MRGKPRIKASEKNLLNLVMVDSDGALGGEPGAGAGRQGERRSGAQGESFLAVPSAASGMDGGRKRPARQSSGVNFFLGQMKFKSVGEEEAQSQEGSGDGQRGSPGQSVLAYEPEVKKHTGKNPLARLGPQADASDSDCLSDSGSEPAPLTEAQRLAAQFGEGTVVIDN